MVGIADIPQYVGNVGNGESKMNLERSNHCFHRGFQVQFTVSYCYYVSVVSLCQVAVRENTR